MQDQTKQEHAKKDSRDGSKGRRSNGMQIDDTFRLASPGADALREAHMNLVRAEQNLYRLIQTSPPTLSPYGPAVLYGAPSPYGSAGFGFPPAFTPPTAPGIPAPGYPTTPYAAGITPPTAFGSPVGASFGIPGFHPWAAPTSTAAWNPWTGSISPPASVATGYPYGNTSVPALAPGQWTPTTSGIPSHANGVRTPACDIVDDGKQFVCTLEIPGVPADQVELLCFEHAIAINAYRVFENPEIANLVQAERGNPTQQRVIALPNLVQPGMAKATLSDGVLTIVLPKLHPTEEPRRIAVQG